MTARIRTVYRETLSNSTETIEDRAPYEYAGETETVESADAGMDSSGVEGGQAATDGGDIPEETRN